MVRPVEPDPPDALRRVPERVKGATETPDKLGQPPVEKRREQQHHSPGAREEWHPLDGDEVTLEHSGAESDSAEPNGRPRGDEGPPADHIDVNA